MTKKFLCLGLLVTMFHAKAELKIMNSYTCAEKNPEAKKLMTKREKVQKTAEAELQELGKELKKISEDGQKAYNNLMGMQATAKADSPDLKKVRSEVEEKQMKMQELQAKGQRMMQEAQAEIQSIDMQLQPYILSEIQSGVELASKMPNIDLYDEYSHQFVHKSAGSDLNAEVVKLSQKKSEQKTTTAKAPSKAPATKAA